MRSPAYRIGFLVYYYDGVSKALRTSAGGILRRFSIMDMSMLSRECSRSGISRHSACC